MMLVHACSCFGEVNHSHGSQGRGMAWHSFSVFAKDYSALVERKPHRHGGADSSKLVPLLWLACKIV